MEKITLNNKEVIVSELGAMDAVRCDFNTLVSVNAMLDAFKSWGKTTFELSFENPKLFIDLMAKSTGEKKKFIKKLKAKDYDLLAFTFLSVNSEFFIQRLKIIQMVVSDGE